MTKDKMWNGIGWYRFIGPTASTTDISLLRPLNNLKTDPSEILGTFNIRKQQTRFYRVCS